MTVQVSQSNQACLRRALHETGPTPPAVVCANSSSTVRCGECTKRWSAFLWAGLPRLPSVAAHGSGSMLPAWGGAAGNRSGQRPPGGSSRHPIADWPPLCCHAVTRSTGFGLGSARPPDVAAHGLLKPCPRLSEAFIAAARRARRADALLWRCPCGSGGGDGRAGPLPHRSASGAGALPLWQVGSRRCSG